MIRRVTDPEELAVLARACGLVGRFEDDSEYLESANVLGWGRPLRGAFLFKPITESSTEGHMMVHPKHRGREAIEAGRAVIAAMLRIGLSIVAPAPRARRDVRLYTRQVGMRWAGETHESVFMFAGGG